MQSPCTGGKGSQACFHGCFGTPFLGLPGPSNPKSTATAAAASRFDFAVATVSSLLPDTHLFTNHECLPTLSESLSLFTAAFPQYTLANQADRIRDQEYYHLALSNHVCLDYIGLGLFSHSQCSSADAAIASSSTASLPPRNLQFPFFDVCYKSASLSSQLLYRGQESELESALRKRIMDSLNISETDYTMVFTANPSSSLRLLTESYPFQSNKRLLTVYDYESEAITTMIDNSQKQGAKVMSAEFSWPSMRIHSTKLRKMVVSKRKKRKGGMFVFPLQSRMTGTRYSYQWLNLAQENGWHVVLDASALGAKDMETLGLSLFRPDFLICSFYMVFGENPSGFACLFVKKSSAQVLDSSNMARSVGIVSLVPANKSSQLLGDTSGTDMETQQTAKIKSEEEDLATTNSLSPPPMPTSSGEESQHVDTEEETVEVKNAIDSEKNMMIQCRGLDHTDSLGLLRISNRAICLINWLVNALTKLHHPHSENGLPLVQIYGPKIKFNRGPAVAFNVFDWKGEKADPMLVLKLADRNNISLSYGFLHNLWFADKYEEEKERVLESRTCDAQGGARKKTREKGITVVTASLGFLTNFEDTYRLWAFVARFLDADFVEKERWRFMALNQQIVEV